MDEKKGYYAIIPANVRYDKGLTPNAKLLYGEVTALCNQEGYCWAGNAYFAELYEVNKVSVSKWVNQLVKRGYLNSTIQYKKGTKEIEHRYLSIVNTPPTKMDDPIKEKFNTPSSFLYDPVKEKFKGNTTVNTTINKETMSGKPDVILEDEKTKDEKMKDDIIIIVEHLNNKADKHFRHNTKATSSCIKVRLNEGFKPDEFVRVIDKKVIDWKNDKNMDGYLRPQTLFGSKFESYLNETDKPSEKRWSKHYKSVKDVISSVD